MTQRTDDHLYELADNEQHNEEIVKLNKELENIKTQLAESKLKEEAARLLVKNQQNTITEHEQHAQQYQEAIQELKDEILERKAEEEERRAQSVRNSKKQTTTNREMQTDPFVDKQTQALMKATTDLNAQVADQKQIIYVRDNEIQELKNKIVNQQRATEQKLTDAARNIKLLQQQLQETQEDRNNYCELYNRQLHENEEQTALQQQQNEQNQKAFQAAESSIHHLQQSLDKQRQRFEEDRLQYSRQNAQEREVLLDKTAKLSAELQQTQRELLETKHSWQQRAAEATTLKQSIENIGYTHNKTVQDIRSQVDSLSETLKVEHEIRHQHLLNDQKENEQKHKEQVETLVRQLKDQQRKHESEIQKKDAVVQEMKEQRSVNERLLAQKERTIQMLTDGTPQTVVDDAADKAAELTNLIKAQADTIGYLRKELEEKMKETQRLQSSVGAKEERLPELKRQRSDSELQFTKMALEEAEIALEQLTRENQKLKREKLVSKVTGREGMEVGKRFFKVKAIRRAE